MPPRTNKINPPAWGQYLRSIYFNPRKPGSFQGAQKLRQTARKEGQPLGRQRITRWLNNEESFSSHRAFLPGAIQRSRVFVKGMFDQYDADLADFQKLADSNDGYRFILVVIDVFTRYLWAIPLKSKKNTDVINGFEHIFRNEGKVPRRLRTDQGVEFTGNIMTEFYEHYNVTHFVTYNEVKANYAERVIRTLKGKITRYLAYQKTWRYIDVLADLVESYNNTIHKSIQLAPIDVNQENEIPLWWMQYRPREPYDPNGSLPSYKFKVGDSVRIADTRGLFSRDWRLRWSEEIFKIVTRDLRDMIPIYKLEDEQGEEIKGTFYENEMQKVVEDQSDQWKVESIVDVRGQGQNKEAFVKFKDWPEFYNRWIAYDKAQNSLRTQRE